MYQRRSPLQISYTIDPNACNCLEKLFGHLSFPFICDTTMIALAKKYEINIVFYRIVQKFYFVDTVLHNSREVFLWAHPSFLLVINKPYDIWY